MGKFQIFINDDDEPIWESEVEANVVDQVTLTGVRGEITVVGSPGTDTWLRIRVNERAQYNTYLDMVEDEKAQERRDRFEKDSEGDGEHVEADPETGRPKGGPSTQEEQEEEKAMAGDVEF